MAICYLLGMLLRMIRGLREELIPLILGLCGTALGVAGMHLIPDFPARDVMKAAGIGIGIVSALAALKMPHFNCLTQGQK